jgi:uncharacterized protein involved in exopolysaccharide biosynthesis
LCTTSFALIIFFTFLTTPIYEATAKILIRPNPQLQLILFKDLATPGKEFPRINPAGNLIQILTSQEMAQQVVKKFRLDERLRKKTEEPEELRNVVKRSLVKAITYPIRVIQNLRKVEKRPPNYFADAVEYLIEEVEDIQLQEGTDVISLSIWEETPKLSSDIANYMAKRLIIKSHELDQSSAGNAYDFTKEQVQVAEKTLRISENELLRFKKKENIISLEEQKEAKLKELHRLEGEYINVKVALSEERAKLEQMRGEISRQKQILSHSTIVANNPVVTALRNSLNNTEIQLAGDLERFTKSSKNVKRLRAQSIEGRAKIKEELKKITQSDIATLYSIHSDLPNEYIQLTINVASLEAKKGALEKEIDTLKAETFSLSTKEIELEKLNRKIETNEKLHSSLSDKFSELEVQKASQMSGYDLKTIDTAFIPEDAKPDRPKWILVIPLGFIGSMLLGFGTVFFIEYWDESFKSPREIEERIGLPVLCTVPNMRR